MFILYDYDVHTIIDKSEDEGDIISTINDFLIDNKNQRFLIVSYDETNTPDTRTIKNVRDYYNYVLEYNDRLKNMTCVELKRKILKRNDK